MEDEAARIDDMVALWDWRRRVSEMYVEVRRARGDRAAWQRWRAARDELFAEHPQTPIEADARGDFTSLDYFDHDASWEVEARLDEVEPESSAVAHSGEGTTTFTRFAKVSFTRDGVDHELDLFWLESYGGGVFLPFRDATSGSATYAGGRYLLDTAKGADLGGAGRHIHLDFNYAYHPSCVYSPRWSCPLAPPGNVLELEVRAGERLAASKGDPDQ